MKKNLLKTIAFTLGLFSTGLVMAQADRVIYAITDATPTGLKWGTLRKIDASTGKYSETVLDGSNTQMTSFDAFNRKPGKAQLKTNVVGALADAPFASSVAAIAYDKKNDRLYYTPMLVDQLRYIDLKTNKVYFVNNVDVTGAKVYPTDQSNIITRMAIASDGFGYAISNDGKHVVQFSTDDRFTVKDLGAITDIMQPDNVSIHNACSSYGGDAVADDAGNLYVFSATGHTFKVNMATLTSTHLGKINGLPAGYTVNGAAVNDQNKVLISSANNNSGLYSLDLSTMDVELVSSANYFTSDLASANLITDGKKKPTVKTFNTLVKEDGAAESKVSLYPNPVTTDNFNMQFALPSGSYRVMIQDAIGRNLKQTRLVLNGTGQVENFRIPFGAKKGMYLINVLDNENKSVYTQKVLVQ